MAFPAKVITTNKSWEDFDLTDEIKAQVDAMINWVKSHDESQNGSGKGYKALFHGPPKSGKKTAAAYIGKETGRDIYKIDLSQLISKYVGETEKNLEVLFARAEEKKWILYFDEADDLFGKQAEGKEADDKYGNTEIFYLLQNIWHYAGLMILTTKKKEKIEASTMKKFDAVLNFPSKK
ncbi:MAG TPA: ATP-binding protein [Flavitalea sp.]|nr:ATP-binding protein [Flavitalea sp.]